MSIAPMSWPLAAFAALALKGSATARTFDSRGSLIHSAVCSTPRPSRAIPAIARPGVRHLVQYREGSSDVEPGLATLGQGHVTGSRWNFRSARVSASTTALS